MKTSAYDQVLNERRRRYSNQGFVPEKKKPSILRNNSSVASHQSGNSQGSIDKSLKKFGSNSDKKQDGLKSE